MNHKRIVVCKWNKDKTDWTWTGREFIYSEERMILLILKGYQSIDAGTINDVEVIGMIKG